MCNQFSVWYKNIRKNANIFLISKNRCNKSINTQKKLVGITLNLHLIWNDFNWVLPFFFSFNRYKIIFIPL